MPSILTLCTLQLGHTARGRLEPVEDGIPAVQLRDTRPEGGMAAQGVGRYRMDEVPDRYWAQAGDVLFRSRGDKNTATVLDPDFGGPAVAMMPLVILRPKRDQVDPNYLAWCINQPSAQRHFDECARGTGMRMIPIGCLSNLDIPVPDIASQRTIAEIDKLAAREHDLATRLAGRRRQLTAFALMERANQNASHQNGAHRAAAPRSGKKGDQ